LKNSLYNLENRLFDGYQSNILPVQNPNTITTVSIDFTLLQLINTDGIKNSNSNFQTNINLNNFSIILRMIPQKQSRYQNIQIWY
jgi:hypothetical protein